MKRTYGILGAILLLGCVLLAVANGQGLTLNPWSDTKSNDVIVKQTFMVDVFTTDNGKNFKFSFTRPVETFPGYWCVIVSSDVHSDYIGNFPYQHCWDYKSMTPEEQAYTNQWGTSLEYFNNNLGNDHPEKGH